MNPALGGDEMRADIHKMRGRRPTTSVEIKSRILQLGVVPQVFRRRVTDVVTRTSRPRRRVMLCQRRAMFDEIQNPIYVKLL